MHKAKINGKALNLYLMKGSIMKKINTLDDMLVEVQKYDEDAYINDEHFLFISFYLRNCEWAITQLDSGTWKLANCLWSDTSTNPQDILNIICSIYNCGKPEEEKVK